MPTVIDSLLVLLRLDSSQFKAGSADAVKAQDELKDSALASATATEKANTKSGASSAKRGKAERAQSLEDKKRKQQAEREEKERHEAQRKRNESAVGDLKALGRFAALAVIGVEGVKSAIAAYAQTSTQLATLGRFAPTVGMDAHEVNKLGNALEQVGGKAEDAQADLAKIGHAQFSYAMGAPDAMASWARRQGIALFDKEGKNRDKLDVLKDIGEALRKATPDTQAQAMYAREMGISEASIQLYVLNQADARERILDAAEKANKVTKDNVTQAEALSTAWNRVKQHATAAKQSIVGATSTSMTDMLNIGTDKLDKGGFANDAIGTLSIIEAPINGILSGLGLPYIGADGQWKKGKGATSAGKITSSMFDKESGVQKSGFREAEKKYGLPTGILENIARQESNFNPFAVNDKSGARGLMQLMPKYFPNAGQNQQDDIDEAGKLMQRLMKKYGNMQLALAAYNDGEGNVDARIKGGQMLPEETRNYVPSVLSGMPGGAAGANFGAAAVAPPNAVTPAAPPTAMNGGHTSIDIGEITIQTQATDANGIAGSIDPALRRKGIVAQANSGMA